jgi:hypothetical protein
VTAFDPWLRRGGSIAEAFERTAEAQEVLILLELSGAAGQD